MGQGGHREGEIVKGIEAWHGVLQVRFSLISEFTMIANSNFKRIVHAMELVF